MSSLFRNGYKVYLYKYNYKALQNKVESLLSENITNKFLFESFVTNLYTLGIPSDDVIKEISGKYKQYVDEFKMKKPVISNANQQVVKNTGDSKTIEYKPIKEDTDFIVKHERATISEEENLLQEALAQNYALQKLQQDYEDTMMAPSSAKINWMSTIEARQTYDTYITNALKASKKLLDELFKPVIDELAQIQRGGLTSSNYVYVIDLTDLAQGKILDKIQTDRTKYSDDDFMRTTANRVLADDTSGNAVDSIGAITTTLEGLSNMTSFNLRQDVLLHHGITIEANDIIEIVDTSYNNVLRNEKEFIEKKLEDSTQFIGFVTKVSLSQRFSETSLLNVTCEGISKMLSLNPTISSNAVAPQFYSVAKFISGEDSLQKTSDANAVNAFSTFFDGLNAYDLFVKLLSDTLAVTPVEEDKVAYSMRLVSDPDKLKALPYQYAKPLLVLYHFAVTYSTLRRVADDVQYKGTHIILARLDNNVNQEKLQAYLLMIRSHFDLFWSNMTTPMTILQTLANNTFLEIFEDRSGILILRPPRYNTWIEGDVINEDVFIEWTQSIDDSSLKSRSDYQWSIPALGVQNEFCGGYYQDIPALLKYGFRIDAPKSSPSVQSEIDAAVYSALDVTKSNGSTRTFELTVPLTQDYKLGRLYYFPDTLSKDKYGTISSTGFVGYLTNITTMITPGNVDTHRLTFKYMRAAECIEANTGEGLAGGSTTILNFKRLPELAMYQGSVTESMLTKTQQDNLKDKARRLVSNSRYYWASYQSTNKNTFDKAIDGNISLSEGRYKELYKTMAPTNIRVGDFATLNDIKSSDFIPSQQLINSIWCADILSRTGYSEDDYDMNIKDVTTNVKLNTRELRIRDNEKKLLKYLQRDKSIKNIGNINYINDKSNFSAPYATVNQIIKKDNKNTSLGTFLILDSRMPNINTEFATEYSEYIKTYMRSVTTAYNKYNADDNFRLWYLQNSGMKTWAGQVVTKITLENLTVNSDLTNLLDARMTAVGKCVDAFNEALNNIYKFDDFYNKYIETRSDMDKLLEYYDERHNFSVVKQIKDVINNLPGMSFIKKITNYITDPGLDSKLIQNVEVGVPSYLVNTNSQLPAVHSLMNTGSYVAGVCSIDYAPFLKKLNAKVLSALQNKSITFKNMNVLNGAGVSIGTITKLIYDPNLSDDENLYFYPVVQLVSDNELAKAYPGVASVSSRLGQYILTESEINAFIQDKKSDKNLAFVVRVTPTCIPETKLPTIQQVYNQEGLHVGYDREDDKNSVNKKKAIFNPGVLFTWNNSEVEQLYTVNVYNFIECCIEDMFGQCLSCSSKSNDGKSLNIQLNKEIPWNSSIQSNKIYSVPCVSNTKLSISKLDIPAIGSELETAIKEYFISLSVANEYEINYCTESDVPTGYLYIKDLQTADDRATQLALTFDHPANLSTALYYHISDDINSSWTKNHNNTSSSGFMQSVEDKEYTQVSLYNYGPYMPYSTKDWYPNYVLIGRLFLVRDTLNITVVRTLLTDGETHGKMYLNGKEFCDTLEDRYRGDDLSNNRKVDQETAIPNGKYRTIVDDTTLTTLDNSGKLPLLLDVKYFTDVRIHTGTNVSDTAGCILIGDYKNGVWKANSLYVTRLKALISMYRLSYTTVVLSSDVVDNRTN